MRGFIRQEISVEGDAINNKESSACKENKLGDKIGNDRDR